MGETGAELVLLVSDDEAVALIASAIADAAVAEFRRRRTNEQKNAVDRFQPGDGERNQDDHLYHDRHAEGTNGNR